MKKEKLYTKYKFNLNELEILCSICKLTPDKLADKLDNSSYEERKALYQTITLMKSIMQNYKK